MYFREGKNTNKKNDIKLGGMPEKHEPGEIRAFFFPLRYLFYLFFLYITIVIFFFFLPKGCSLSNHAAGIPLCVHGIDLEADR